MLQLQCFAVDTASGVTQGSFALTKACVAASRRHSPLKSAMLQLRDSITIRHLRKTYRQLCCCCGQPLLLQPSHVALGACSASTRSIVL